MLSFSKTLLFCVFTVSFNALGMNFAANFDRQNLQVGPGGSIRNEIQMKALGLATPLVPMSILQRSMCEVRRTQSGSNIAHILDTQSERRYFLIIQSDWSHLSFVPLYDSQQMASFTQEQRQQYRDAYDSVMRLFNENTLTPQG